MVLPWERVSVELLIMGLARHGISTRLITTVSARLLQEPVSLIRRREMISRIEFLVSNLESGNSISRAEHPNESSSTTYRFMEYQQQGRSIRYDLQTSNASKNVRFINGHRIMPRLRLELAVR